MLEKKKVSKKSRSKKLPVVDLISVGDMSRAELEQHVERIRKELEKEREERNYFILERDKINTFWEIAKEELEDRSSELRIREREFEVLEERHQMEIKIYKQKIKQLMISHQENVFDMKYDAISTVNLSMDEISQQTRSISDDMQRLKASHRISQVENEHMLHNLKMLHEKQLCQMQQDFEFQLEEGRRLNEEKLKKMNENMELQRKTELHETEERKNSQLDQQIKNHEKSFTDMRNYYNDITLNNLTLISSLKEQLADTKKKNEIIEKTNSDLCSRIDFQEEEIRSLKQESKTFRKSIKNNQSDSESLRVCKSELLKTEKKLKNLNLDYEIILQRLKFVENERDELYDKFLGAVQKVQQRCGLKNAILEHRLCALDGEFEKNEIHLGATMPAENVNPVLSKEYRAKNVEKLLAKNSTMKNLQNELEMVCKTYQDLLSAFRNKLDIHGASSDQFGLPIRNDERKNQLFQKIENGSFSIVR